MLVLSRKETQRIRLGQDIVIYGLEDWEAIKFAWVLKLPVTC